MPATADQIREQLAAPRRLLQDVFCPSLKAGHRIGLPAPLFQQLLPEQVRRRKTLIPTRKKSLTPFFFFCLFLLQATAWQAKYRGQAKV